MFELPTTFQKELAVTTQKVYKSKLNALAAHGIDTKDKLEADPAKAIEAIQEITGDEDDDKTKHTRRTILSAIFWVIPEVSKGNAYYKYYQKCLPTVDDSTGKKWVKRKNFKG